MKTLGYWGCTSFLFSFFKWFFAAESTTGLSCGFDAWPSLGIKALGYTWQFDFELTYIGVGARGPFVPFRQYSKTPRSLYRQLDDSTALDPSTAFYCTNVLSCACAD